MGSWWVEILGWMAVALGAILLIPSMQLGLLGIGALLQERRQRRDRITVRPDGSPRTRFAVVVPAHDEEEVIAWTLRSIRSQQYPADAMEIWVVADNCTDATASIAAAEGAHVLERRDPMRRGKGHALRWAFHRLLEMERHDAVLVVDADSMLSPNALDELNRRIQDGWQVLQIDDQVVPNHDSWSSEITRLGFFLYNYIRPMGQSRFGLPVGLRGNGMCFTTSLLSKVPWSAFSIAEDLEFGLRLITAGHRPGFVAQAQVLARMPASPGHAVSQRSRWELGRLPLIRHAVPDLIRAAVHRREPGLLSTLVDLLTPPATHLYVLLGAVIAASVVPAFGGSGVWIAALCLSAAGSLFLHIHLLSAFGSERFDPTLRRAFSHAPIYVLWKARVYMQALLFGPEKRWIRTTRDRIGPDGGIRTARED